MGKEKNVKTNAMRILDKAKISYQTHEYEVDEHIDGISVAGKLGQSMQQLFKTLVTKGKNGGYFVFVIPVEEELDLKKAAKSVGEKAVEMIPVKDILIITGYLRGGCSPIGMKKEYQTRIHQSALTWSSVMISGGKRGVEIEIRPADLGQIVHGEFTDLIMEK